MGICVACFTRDIAGALGLHRAAVVQYLRPEIIGFVLGASGRGSDLSESSSRAGFCPAGALLSGYVCHDRRVGVPGLSVAGIPAALRRRLERHTGIVGLTAGIGIGVLFLTARVQSRPAAGPRRRRSGGSCRPLPRHSWSCFWRPLSWAHCRGGSDRSDLFLHNRAWIGLCAHRDFARRRYCLSAFSRSAVAFCTVGAVRDLILVQRYVPAQRRHRTVVAALLPISPWSVQARVCRISR